MANVGAEPLLNAPSDESHQKVTCAAQNAVAWEGGAFACMDDPQICFYGCCCTPCLFASVASGVHRDESLCCSCGSYVDNCSDYAFWLYCFYAGAGYCAHKTARKKLATSLGIQDTGDLGWQLCCCDPCLVCQEARTLKRLGKFKGICASSDDGELVPGQQGGHESTDPRVLEFERQFRKNMAQEYEASIGAFKAQLIEKGQLKEGEEPSAQQLAKYKASYAKAIDRKCEKKVEEYRAKMGL